MTKFLQIAGIIAVAAGVAIALMASLPTSSSQMQIFGLTREVSAILLMGGLLLIGIGGVISAIEQSRRATIELRDWLAGNESNAGELPMRPSVAVQPAAVAPAIAAAAVTAAAEAAADEASATARLLDEARTKAEVETAAAKAKAEELIEKSKVATEETLASLDKAKEEISKSLDIAPEPEATPLVEVSADVVEEIEALEEDDDQLYVVEERLVRGRPARILSDGTVEAETDEGWMRFENLEHLEEYLDAMSPARS